MRDIIVASQIIACFVLLIDLIYICFQRPSSAQTKLIILSVSTLIMLVGYLVEILADNIDTAITGTAIAYIGKPFALLTTFLFCAEFCGKKFSNRWILFHALISAVFPVLIFTNNWLGCQKSPKFHNLPA